MFSSRNIHYAILGIILGASAGYIFAFYQAQSAAAPAPIAPQANSEGLPAGHPGGPGSNDQAANDLGLDELKKAVEQSPNDPDLLARYGTRLFTSGRIPEAMETYEKVLAMQPNNLTVRSLLIAMLFSLGKTPEAKKHLEVALGQNPSHVPSLHGLFLVTLEGDHDVNKAAEILQTIEKLQPSYQGLPDLRKRLEEVRKAPK